MATDDELLKKVQDLNRFRATQWARAGASLPGGFRAAQTGGPGAMREYVRGWFPQPEKVDPSKVFEAKQDLIKLMADMQSDRSGKVVDLQKELTKTAEKWGGLIEKALTTAGTVYGNYADAAARGAQTKQSAKTELTKNVTLAMKNAYEAQYGTRSLGDADRWVGKALDTIARSGSPDENYVDDEQMSLLLNDLRVLPSDQRALYLQRLRDTQGSEPLIAQIEQANAQIASGVPASPIAAELAGMMQQSLDNPGLAQAQEKALDEMKGLALEQLHMATGSWPPEMKQVGDLAIDILGKFGVDPKSMNPEKMNSLINEAVKENIDTPGSQIPMDKAEALLAQLDQPQETMPANIAEARKRLLEDPDFQAAMIRDKFNDPGMYLKHLRKKLADKVYANKMTDAARMREERRTGRPAEAGSLPSSSSAAASGDIGEAGEIGSAQTPSVAKKPEAEVELVRDERTGDVMVMEGGWPRPATKLETANFERLSPEQQQKQTRSLAQEIKEESVRDILPTTGQPPPLKKLESLPDLPAPTTAPAVPQSLRQLGIAATHPGAAIRRLLQEARARREKKLEQDDDEGADGQAEDLLEAE